MALAAPKKKGAARQALQEARGARPQVKRAAPQGLSQGAPASPGGPNPMSSSLGAFQSWRSQQPPLEGAAPQLGGSFPSGGFTGGGGGGLPQMQRPISPGSPSGMMPQLGKLGGSGIAQQAMAAAKPQQGLGFQPPQDPWSRQGKLGGGAPGMGSAFGRSAGGGGLF